MLSAEHYALEHRAIQQLLDIRQKEVAFLTDRFNAIGTQSALVAGFVVTTLTAVDAGTEDTNVIARWAFWLSSALSLALSFHCILNSTFAAVWGPGLSLRGPSGSVSRAYFILRSDQNHVMIAFVGSIFFFIVECAATFFVLDHVNGLTSSGLINSLILFLGGIVSSCYLWRMYKRMKYRSVATEKIESAILDDDYVDAHAELIGQGRSKGRSSESVGKSLSSSYRRGAATHFGDSRGEGGLSDSIFSFKGYLYRRGRKTKYLGSWAAYWKLRYFVLDRAALYCFRSKEEFEELVEKAHVVCNKPAHSLDGGPASSVNDTSKKKKKTKESKAAVALKSPLLDGEARAALEEAERGAASASGRKLSHSSLSLIALAKVFAEAETIPLEGYEVLVDTRMLGKKPCLEFELSRMDRRGIDKIFDRDLHFRAQSQSELKSWLQALVAATIVSQGH